MRQKKQTNSIKNKELNPDTFLFDLNKLLMPQKNEGQHRNAKVLKNTCCDS